MIKLEVNNNSAALVLNNQITEAIGMLNKCRDLLATNPKEAYSKFDFELLDALPRNLEEYVSSCDS